MFASFVKKDKHGTYSGINNDELEMDMIWDLWRQVVFVLAYILTSHCSHPIYPHLR